MPTGGQQLKRLSGAWSPQLAVLRDEFPVVAVDLPGHGARSAGTWSLKAAVEVIADAVESLGRGRPAPVRFRAPASS